MAKEAQKAAEDARNDAKTEIGKTNANMKTKNDNLNKRPKDSFALRDGGIDRFKEENQKLGEENLKLSEEFAKLLRIVNDMRDGIKETRAKSSDKTIQPPPPPPPPPKAKQSMPSPAKTPKRPRDEDKISPSPKKAKQSKPSPAKAKTTGKATGKATGEATGKETKRDTTPTSKLPEKETRVQSLFPSFLLATQDL
ncbi:hypothetical protein MGU_01429 [Metarhizium guizhouense ARSEF 977]|uniref:Uncharacterized protein n=1 Tax=Metarhizium guizhouense (strain ARSEF 977) TaxID=1276136 RepID=A0A0B4IB88_METGA|nr:hypothetical protein MGU_01429 [Metarhizium guizhouense ARSEF 977]